MSVDTPHLDADLRNAFARQEQEITRLKAQVARLKRALRTAELVLRIVRLSKRG